MPSERQILAAGAFFVWVAICLSIAVTAIFVAAHFISKFW